MRNLATLLFLLTLFGSSLVFAESQEEPAKSREEYIKEYLDEVKKLVQPNWFPSLYHSAANPIIKIVLFEDGAMSEMEIIYSSGNQDIDEEARQAILNSLPFTPVADEFIELLGESYLEIELDFESLITKEQRGLIDANFKQFTKQVFSKLEYPTDHNYKSGEVEVSFDVADDGSVSNFGVIKTDMDKQFIKACFSAIKRAAPFPTPDNNIVYSCCFGQNSCKDDKFPQLEMPKGDEIKNTAEYIAVLQNQIKAAWKPKHYTTDIVKSSFKVLQDGSVKNLELIQTSKSKEFDDYCLETINRAAPFREIPKHLLKHKKETINEEQGEAFYYIDGFDIEFEFNYNRHIKMNKRTTKLQQ